MTNSFSVRQGIIKPTSLNPNDMPIGLRNRLWNATNRYINGFIYTPSRNAVIEHLWGSFFKKDVDTLTSEYVVMGGSSYNIIHIKKKFYDSEWNEIYDFLEFLLSIENYQKNSFIDMLNQIFIDERAQYKIIDGIITPLISEVEVGEVEKAINSKYSLVSDHIKNALECYSKRPVADSLNSIKESISAIEALAQIVLDKPKTTLGDLADQLDIHPAFKKGIKNFYGWTSDEGGIRHANNNAELKSDEREARYMLVQCSALANYIISKTEN